jgi:hypothetical protein
MMMNVVYGANMNQFIKTRNSNAKYSKIKQSLMLMSIPIFIFSALYALRIRAVSDNTTNFNYYASLTGSNSNLLKLAHPWRPLLSNLTGSNPLDLPFVYNSPITTTSLQLFIYNIAFLPVINANVKGYFVSPNGSDSNPGTYTLPWKTIGHAVSKLRAGDILNIRGGTYREVISIHNSGSQTHPITVTNYGNETVTIDGNNMSFPPHQSGTPLISVEGDWVIVKNLTISNSGEYGITVEGDHDVLDNLYVHHNWGNGATLQGDYALAQNLRLWSNSMKNEGGILPVSWGAGISCARYPDHCTIRKSVSWENWGEGISTFESLHTTIEDNISYDNMANFYISDTKYTIVQRNFSYYTPGTMMDFTITNGILVGDELGVPIPLSVNGTRNSSSDNIFINNIVFGGNHGLLTGSSVNNNNLYANNTFGSSGGNTQEQVNVLLNPGNCTNCRFINNIVVQDDDRKIVSVEGSGWIFSNNLWSKTPQSAASSPSDVIGDPLFAQTSNPYSAEWYKLAEFSPAIDKALYLPEINVDFFGNSRLSSPDIGADEFFFTP